MRGPRPRRRRCRRPARSRPHVLTRGEESRALRSGSMARRSLETLTCSDAAAESPATGPQTSESSASAVTGRPFATASRASTSRWRAPPTSISWPSRSSRTGPSTLSSSSETMRCSMPSQPFRRRKDARRHSATVRQVGGRSVAPEPTKEPPVPDTTERADLIGFTLTHSLLRNELPRIAAALAGGPMTPEEEAVVEDHLRLVTDHLIRHHQEEDEFHWPLLASRAPRAAPAARPSGGRAHRDGPARRLRPRPRQVPASERSRCHDSARRAGPGPPRGGGPLRRTPARDSCHRRGAARRAWRAAAPRSRRPTSSACWR